MIRPKSIAPRLIKFPEMPDRTMPVMAKSMESGIARATMMAARQLPSRANKITTTSSAPSARFFSTVPIVALTRFDRS